MPPYRRSTLGINYPPQRVLARVGQFDWAIRELQRAEMKKKITPTIEYSPII